MSAPKKQFPKGLYGKFLSLLNYAQDGQQNGSFLLWLILLPSTVYTALNLSGFTFGLTFPEIFVLAILSGLPLLAGWGYLIQRVVPFFAMGIKIARESDPSSFWYLTPKDIVLVKLFISSARGKADSKAIAEAEEILKKNGVVLD